MENTVSQDFKICEMNTFDSRFAGNIGPAFKVKGGFNRILVAGPCSAESEEQVLDVAHQLAAMGIGVLRAGLWKPRTHPGGFEGVGEKAIAWLQRAKAETGMLIATEVATPSHVSITLDAGFDVLWIGARTTANPFAIQDIADAIASHQRDDVTVLVKNPISPDVELWVGALQRLEGAGVRSLMAVHRGFKNTSTSVYRNDPQWLIPMELKRRYPELPLIVDPSHIAGRRDLVEILCQQSLDMGFDGLMIEVHPHPDEALSDSAQQISPSTLEKILQSLNVRSASAVGDQQLAVLRSLIDHCDDEVFTALSRRMDIVRQIGQLKRETRMPIVQTDRFNQMLKQRIEQAGDLHLSPEFISDILQLIHQEAVTQQL